MTALLKSWLSKGPSSQQLISFNHHDIVTGAVFTGQVAHLHQQLMLSPSKRWLLASESSDLFAVGLCAALLAGKEIILPANTQTGTLSEITHEFDGVISDQAICEGKCFIMLKKDLTQSSGIWPTCKQFGQLVLFTSGSSGHPKAVHKTLEQLDAEVTVLDHTFAQHLPHCSVISTVSHQHIYGLLFKILWPLATSRPFLSNLVEYPETLTYYTSLFPNLCLISSPAQLSRLPDALDNEPQYRSPSLVFSSGGPLHYDAAQGIAHCYGKQPIEVFGSTETGGIAYRRQTEKNQPWQTFHGIEIKQDKKDGALNVKSPYLEDANWLRCEDKIELVDTGLFHLRGRLDRIVKIEEKRVSLIQMEALLESHPLIEQAVLVSLEQPRTQLGAAIVLSEHGIQEFKSQGKLNLNNLFKAHLLTQFERITLPKRWRYPDALPVNQQGKHVQALLLELFNHD
ncbi:AMP-binding protein [Shewanella sp. D64]|uniref:AMP-binding protein n=1 Tax=unclassified Shewanella TaxID=196818 RepID=UPI0022BA17F1|nr:MULTISPECIES: AMP-binding protein [unclassified Shewanella]MEC4726852.1 AMP-binding protein [Shewanella sp. D64]MEC4739036.1 AMP-binding protein [Shewanella sp. E94]WBJ95895.1 AMP-binding protein [Shewanella sp. MTB7]